MEPGPKWLFDHFCLVCNGGLTSSRVLACPHCQARLDPAHWIFFDAARDEMDFKRMTGARHTVRIIFWVVVLSAVAWGSRPYWPEWYEQSVSPPDHFQVLVRNDDGTVHTVEWHLFQNAWRKYSKKWSLFERLGNGGHDYLAIGGDRLSYTIHSSSAAVKKVDLSVFDRNGTIGFMGAYEIRDGAVVPRFAWNLNFDAGIVIFLLVAGFIWSSVSKLIIPLVYFPWHWIRGRSESIPSSRT